MRRLTVSLSAVLAALGMAGCFNQHEGPVTHGETEGIYVEVDGLQYQVQISRPLNPDDPEDSQYLLGVPDDEAFLDRGENWFAVFVRVENTEKEGPTLQSTDKFEIEDTTGERFEPIEVDGGRNVLAYQPAALPPLGKIPAFNTTASDSTTQGSLVLFKIPGENLENRPLEFLIEGRDSEATVDLDV